MNPLPRGVSMGGWLNVLPNQREDYLAGYQHNAAKPGYSYALRVPRAPLSAEGPDGVVRPWDMVKEINDLGVTHVKFWVSWYELAQDIVNPNAPGGLGRKPTTFEEQAQFMDQTHGTLVSQSSYPEMSEQPLISYLDESIKVANNNGKKVILGVYQAAPTWSWTASANPTPEPGTRKTAERHFPADLGADSPYGWFIRYLIARYTGEVTAGPGCGCLPARGNPLGARIDYIEPLNEPNFEWWPQALSVCSASQAMTTCEWWARMHPQYDPATRSGFPPDWNPTDPTTRAKLLCTLGPSGADKTKAAYCDPNWTGPTPDCAASYDPNDDPQYSSYPPKNTGYFEFTDQVLEALREWHPVMPVRWAHHNYHDIEERTDGDPPQDPWQTRVAYVGTLLRLWNFLPAEPETERWGVWLTEGASRMWEFNGVGVGEEQRILMRTEQEHDISTNVPLMESLPDVKLWTQHTINDDIYGLRDPWIAGRGPGKPRPAWDDFKAT